MAFGPSKKGGVDRIADLTKGVSDYFYASIKDKDHGKLDGAIRTSVILKGEYVELLQKESEVKTIAGKALAASLRAAITDISLKIEALKALRENDRLNNFAIAAEESTNVHAFAFRAENILGNKEWGEKLAEWYMGMPTTLQK
ncbi:TPA: hypothetical protein H1005_03300 [archaeon]|uniref:Uncharacterized protein n=1 Tax=Candidatus Naiadarchaeum limnaeum TaxID=2756139 RepID=A0A832URB4_9ARCH|nr:hypothetical protein [Candidatus Naiadarchaeales archaeon SRR2090153.bin1042]HIK00212.1 hypothetical protein [Candidatus Naiadarchaeum limnaeum]